jgi:hypothetical protein
MEWYDFITNYFAELGVGGLVVGQVLYAVWNKIKSNKFKIDFDGLKTLQSLSKSEVVQMSKVVYEQLGAFKGNLVEEVATIKTIFDRQAKEIAELTNLIILLASNLNVPAERKESLFKSLSHITTINEDVKSNLQKTVETEKSIKTRSTTKNTEVKEILKEV